MATKRTQIVKALTEKFKTINGSSPYNVNLFNNAYPILKFWDEIRDFPAVYTSPGSEFREYLPCDFTWGMLTLNIKVYAKGEDAAQELEDILEDVEVCIDLNRDLVYDSTNNLSTTEILVQSIVTDEGLLSPYSVGEITAQVRYQT
jgi:hypothetical protein